MQANAASHTISFQGATPSSPLLPAWFPIVTTGYLTYYKPVFSPYLLFTSTGVGFSTARTATVSAHGLAAIAHNDRDTARGLIISARTAVVIAHGVTASVRSLVYTARNGNINARNRLVTARGTANTARAPPVSACTMAADSRGTGYNSKLLT